MWALLLELLATETEATFAKSSIKKFFKFGNLEHTKKILAKYAKIERTGILPAGFRRFRDLGTRGTKLTHQFLHEFNLKLKAKKLGKRLLYQYDTAKTDKKYSDPSIYANRVRDLNSTWLAEGYYIAHVDKDGKTDRSKDGTLYLYMNKNKSYGWYTFPSFPLDIWILMVHASKGKGKGSGSWLWDTVWTYKRTSKSIKKTTRRRSSKIKQRTPFRNMVRQYRRANKRRK